MSETNGTLVHVPVATAGVLTRFEAAKRALEAARSLDEVKAVRDKAEALRQYTKQAGESLEMQNAVAEIKLRAERKAGDLLTAMEKNKGSRGVGVPFHDGTAPRLQDLGISRQQSHRWQKEADVPEKDFEKFVQETKAKGQELTSASLLDLAREKANQDRLEERTAAARAYATTVTTDDDQGILVGDMSLLGDRLEDGSVDLFFTDPPYCQDCIGTYGRLGALAVSKLKPGGLCLAYTGKINLPRWMNELNEHLSYWWLFCLRLREAPIGIWCRNIQERWKPILAYGRAPLKPAPVWLETDLIEGSGREKDLQDWQQGQGEAEYLIERLTNPGDLIVDPFAGSGTICAAAKAKGRRWLATEIDPDRAAVARQRLAKWQHDEMPLFEESV
jgi:16S rRNA G966 N2-methylase RsmD